MEHTLEKALFYHSSEFNVFFKGKKSTFHTCTPGLSWISASALGSNPRSDGIFQVLTHSGGISTRIGIGT